MYLLSSNAERQHFFTSTVFITWLEHRNMRNFALVSSVAVVNTSKKCWCRNSFLTKCFWMPFAFLKDSFESLGPTDCTFSLSADKFARRCTSCFALEFNKHSLVCLTVRGKSPVKVPGDQMITYIGNVFVQIMSSDFDSTASRCRWKVASNDFRIWLSRHRKRSFKWFPSIVRG